MKSPNKAAVAVAEAMEGRGGAKGNAVRGSTRQTQSWESVSPALDRIRETARRDKRVRFTALLHHVTFDLLHWLSFGVGSGRRSARQVIDRTIVDGVVGAPIHTPATTLPSILSFV
jgi:hypothetical protein